MKLMVIGGGGREHAIIKKLKENPAVEEIYCLPGNGGIAADAVCVSEIGAKDIPAQVEFAKAHGIDYAVVAPDDPLALGAVDALTEAGIPCFGPDKKAAVIEASKAKFTWGVKNGAALAALLPDFHLVEEHSLCEGMAEFAPVYKLLGKIPAVSNISNRIVVLEKK